MLRTCLDGLTVVDFTQIAAGPTCTMLLGDMGAHVIKVEPPEGDLGRTLGPAWLGEDSALFHGFNRNKHSLCLDLKAPAGLAVAKKIIARADVLVESMRPGAMERLGLGHDSVCSDHPRLVYCSISAYGQSGPCASQAGVDGILQADTGLMSLIGSPGGEPGKVQAPVVDMVTGYIACIGVLAKLNERARDGVGGHLDVNLMNSALALQQASLASYLADRQLPARIGSAAPYSAPNEAFETADGWMMVAAYNGNRWDRLCEALGVPELARDARFSSSQRRVANRPAMRQALAARFQAHTTAHWLALLRRADILCARVSTYADVEAHPQVAANGMLAQVQHPLHGSVRFPGFPINSRQENELPHSPAPARGEHSRAVLAAFDFAEHDISKLVEDGVVQCPAGGRQPQPA
jgi:crotonobetainyl-CoA:carnitine CoA-transferase CaiB-like acyl-CoA transferase